MMQMDAFKELEKEIFDLRLKLTEKENKLAHLNNVAVHIHEALVPNGSNLGVKSIGSERVLTNEEINRYSRQLIIPEFGVVGQLKLKHTSFLIVGTGGLGCPAAQYLVSAGCGILGLVDYDVVDITNLHRQILFSEKFCYLPKVLSAKASLSSLNSNTAIKTYQCQLNKENTLQLVEKYDIILDCSDNVATRYLLNDACVMKAKPLVSGSALQFDGQLTVYNYNHGPCYRCLFPVPPPPDTVTNCDNGGILGAVTGVIGSLQALEAIKVALGLGEVLAGRLLLFDGCRCIFRNIKLRSKRKDCNICSDQPLVTQLIDYELFCGMRASDKDISLSILHKNHRMSAMEYKTFQNETNHILIDVRSASEFEICKLENAINIPLKQILNDSQLPELQERVEKENLPVVILCRRGNDSQIAVEHLRSKMPNNFVKDIVGGLYSWHYKVDLKFPIY